MKKILFTAFLTFVALISITTIAQTYSNEWIDYSKTYYKFKVIKDGQLHRIPYNTLNTAGLGSAAGTGYKLFAKGAEVPIYVSTNGNFTASDYIEFYARANDGKFDTQLYEDPTWQPNIEKSLFADTLTYFLMWDANNTNGLRLSNQDNTPQPIIPAAEPYFIHTSTYNHFNVHNVGIGTPIAGTSSNYADFEEVEGFVGLQISAFQNATFNIPTASVYPGPLPLATFKFKIAGTSDDAFTIKDHHFKITLNGKDYFDNGENATNKTFSGYKAFTDSVSVFINDLASPNTVVKYFNIGDQSTEDRISPIYSTITYPHTFDFENKTIFRFDLEDNKDTYLAITNFNAGANPIFYDLTNKTRIVPILDNGTYKIYLPAGANTNIKRTCVFANTGAITSIQSVAALKATNFTNFSNLANQGDYIIIYQKSLTLGASNPINDYKTYRQSIIGGAHTVVLADIDELYDQFSWGISKHPLSIQNFLNYAFDNWANDPQFLFLIGKSIGYNSFRFNAPAYAECLVPSFGQHPSDNKLAATLGSYIPRLPIGRLSAKTPANVTAFLNKVINYEQYKDCTRADRLWTKNIAHVVSGYNQMQVNEYKAYTDTLANIIEDTLFGGNLQGTYIQSLPSPLQDQPGFDNALNKGLGLVTMIGHSTQGNVWNFDVEDVTFYNNVNKYPLFVAGSCFVGNIHNYGVHSMAEDFVLANNKGAIGYLATVTFGIPSYLNVFCNELYQQVGNESYGEPIGVSILNALKALYVSNPNTPGYAASKLTAEEYTYEGDPALQFIAYPKPEYLIEYNSSYQDIEVFNTATNSEIIPQNISSPFDAGTLTQLTLKVTVTNLGKATGEPVNITIKRTLPGGSVVTVVDQNFPSPDYQKTYNFIINLNPGPNTFGLNLFTVYVDGDNLIEEDCDDNNQAQIAVDMKSPSCINAPVANITTNLPSEICTSNSSYTLAATPTGGTFLIDNQALTNNILSPQNEPLGPHTITYQYNDAISGCTVYDYITFNIISAPTVDFNLPTSVCTNQPIYVSPNTPLNNVTYSFNFNGATFTPVGNNTYEVIWTTSGTKSIILSGESGGCIALPKQKTITVVAPLATPIVTCGSTTTNSVSFNWNSIAGATNYKIKYSVDGGAPIAVTLNDLTYTIQNLIPGQTVNIEVVPFGNDICPESKAVATCVAQDCPLVVPAITNLKSNYCLNDPIVSLAPLGSPSGGTFYIDDIEQTELNPIALGFGNHLIKYVYKQSTCQYFTNEIPFTINFIPSPILSADDNSLCPNQTATLSLSTTYSQYNWSNNQNTQTIEVATAGNYTVTVTNIEGCKNTASISVTTNNFTAPVITTSQNDTILCGDNDHIVLSLEGVYETYQWQPVGISSSFNATSAGTYTVTVTDFNACSGSTSIAITEGSLNPPTILVNDNPTNVKICPQQTSTLAVQGFYNNYVWSNNQTTSSIEITTGGTYSVTVSNMSGCSASQEKILTVTQAPTVSINTPTPEICDGGANATLSAGNFSSYQWSNNATTQNIQVNNVNTYSVTITDDNGCSASDDITLTQASVPQVSIVSINGITQVCPGGNAATLDAGVGFSSYKWSNSASTAQISTNTPGNYTVTITNAAGCSNTASFALSTLTVPQPTITPSANGLCAGETITLTVNGIYDSYSWSNGETGNSTVINEIGDYAVLVSLGGCQQSATVTIQNAQNSIPTADFTTNQSGVCVGGTITLQNASLNAGSYAWTITNNSDVQTSTNANPSFTLTQAGTYNITLIATAQCGNATDTKTKNTFITVSNGPSLTITKQTDNLCPGDTIGISATAGLPSYQWRGNFIVGNINTSSIAATPEVSGFYTLTVADELGCAKTDSIEITVKTDCSTELPNVITPNGDNQNDTWYIPQAAQSTNITVEIFNRWGQKVRTYNSYNNADGWDGTNNDGKELPHATYYYIIFLNDGSKPLAGHITILK